MAKNEKRKGKWTDRFRFAIFNDTTFEELWRIRLSKANALLAGALLLVVTELFPPVTHPWWAKPHDGYLPELPLVAYVGDERMNASHKVPQLAIDRPQLSIFWAGIMTAAVIGSYGRSNE